MTLCRPSRTAAPRGRVALIVPRWTDRGCVEPQGTPFRSLTMVGAFLAAGFEVHFADQEVDFDRGGRLDAYVASLADCVAAFVWMNEMYPFHQSVNAQQIAERIRAAHPSLPIVCGGEFVSVCPRGFFDFSHAFHYVLRGYGEATGVQLVEHLLAGTEPVDVEGIVFTTRAGERIDRPAAPRARYSADWLEPYRQLDMEPYVQIGGVLGNDQRTLTIAAGRGCVKGCRFCAWSNHTARILDEDVYFELMVDLRDRFGVRQFHVAELDFFTWPRRALALAERLRAEAPDIVWFALGSPVDLVRLGDAECRALHAGGLRKVEIGSESASARMLRAIGKHHQPEDIHTVSRRLVAHGIRPMNNFLFGFPGETRSDRAASLAMIHRLFRLSPTMCHFTYRYYQPVWGTGSGDEALAAVPDRATRLDRWLADRHRYHVEGERQLPWLPPEDEAEIKELINFQLPLATSRIPLGRAWQGGVYRLLRSRAQRAVATDRRLGRFDRWVFRRAVGRPLDQTYIP